MMFFAKKANQTFGNFFTKISGYINTCRGIYFSVEIKQSSSSDKRKLKNANKISVNLFGYHWSGNCAKRALRWEQKANSRLKIPNWRCNIRSIWWNFKYLKQFPTTAKRKYRICPAGSASAWVKRLWLQLISSTAKWWSWRRIQKSRLPIPRVSFQRALQL